MLAKPVLFGALLWLGQAHTGYPYRGPNHLGPVRVDRDLSFRRLAKEIGEPASKGEPYCFQSPDGRAFLWIVSFHYRSEKIGQALLSEFPNCVNRPVGIASSDIAQWKTEHGIQLGSLEEDVIKAFGKPNRVDKLSPQHAWTLFKGLRDGRRPRMNVGEKKLVYYDTSDDTLRLAEFGIRNGRVGWVLLSQEE